MAPSRTPRAEEASSGSPSPESTRGSEAPAEGSGPLRGAVESSRYAARAGLAGSVLGTLLLLALRSPVVAPVDDAAITFRFARNWAEWGVPAFNSFELEGGAVEGFSNTLWCGLLALAGLVGGVESIPAHARLFELGSAVLTLFVVGIGLARRAGLAPVGSALAPLLVATAAPFVAWSGGGMETALFTLLGAALLHAVLGTRARFSAALLAAGVVLVRAEGIAWAIGFALAARVARGRATEPAAWAAAGALAAFVLQLAWRQVVFGEWLPNTVAAKSGSPAGETALRGARYLASWAAVTVTPLLALLAAVPAARASGPAPRRAARAALVLLSGGVLYNLFVGGDWMPFFRFLSPLTPTLALVLAVALDRVARRGVPVALGLGAAACVLQAVPLYDVHAAPAGVRKPLYFRAFLREGYATERARLERAKQNRAYFSTLGAALDEGLEPGSILAFGAIGWTGWHAPELDFLDRNGLVTPEVALRSGTGDGRGTAGHEKRVPHAWFLDRGVPEARYLFATWVPGTVGAPGGPTLGAVANGLRTRGVTAQPNERELFERTVARAIPIARGAAAGRTLVVLERASAGDAEAFWPR